MKPKHVFFGSVMIGTRMYTYAARFEDRGIAYGYAVKHPDDAHDISLAKELALKRLEAGGEGFYLFDGILAAVPFIPNRQWMRSIVRDIVRESFMVAVLGDQCPAPRRKESSHLEARCAECAPEETMAPFWWRRYEKFSGGRHAYPAGR